MNTGCVRGQHLELRDQKAPYRGKWMICTGTDGLYWALHETSNDDNATDVVEACAFTERHEASRFVQHLMLHGWTVAEFSSGPGFISLLW